MTLWNMCQTWERTEKERCQRNWAITALTAHQRVHRRQNGNVSHGLCDHATDCRRWSSFPLPSSLSPYPLSEHKRIIDQGGPPFSPLPCCIRSYLKKGRNGRETTIFFTRIGSLPQSFRRGVIFPLLKPSQLVPFFLVSFFLSISLAHVLNFFWCWWLLLLSFFL